jgi:transposase
MKTPMKITLNEEERLALNRWVKSRAIGPKQKLRAKIVLMTADGCSTRELMDTLRVSNPTLNLGRRRYQADGLEGLKKGKTRPSRVAPLSSEKVQEVLTLTLSGKPVAATQGSCRTRAQQVGISRMAVQGIWKAHRLKPHRMKGFKVSNDPLFAEKLRDVVGLYLDPPEKAIVFSIDEKSQIQALDRTQPGLPMKPGKYGTMTHDYKRHGTTTLFAALTVQTGTVIGQCQPQHRHDEFLKKLHRETDPLLAVHLIVDNYATHKHPNVGL